MGAQAARLEPVVRARRAGAISGLPLGSLTISQPRQVIGMRMPRPIALQNASLAEKRVAR